MKKPTIFFIIAFFCTLVLTQSISAQVAVQEAPKDLPKEPAANFFLRDSFFLSPELKRKFATYESNDFILIRDMRPDLDSEFALITGFDAFVVETRALKDAKKIEDVNAFLKKSVKSQSFMGVRIKELAIPGKDGTAVPCYWVGQRCFATRDLAQASIVASKTAIEFGGGDFGRAVQLIGEFAPEEPMSVTPAERKANFEREEDFAIKVMDWLDVGEKLYGPIHTKGYPWGEAILWQSFGEGSFRFTNLERDEYNALTAYWTNRLVLKGIWGPWGTTFDPYFEFTPSMESNGPNYKSNIQYIAGIEWYPLIRSTVLQNYRPWGIPIVNFIRNYRLFVQYMERENIKDEITGSKDTDLRAGVDVFYEWGFDLPPLGQIPAKRTKLSQYLYDFIWGEYYGTYHYEETNFSSIENYDSFVLNSSLILGLDWPQIPLPANPVNDTLFIMPYVRFEHVNNPNHPLYYQNRYTVSGGIRLMPFRSYQFSENEWLFKTKLYAEYVGIGGSVSHTANTPVDASNHDVRFGIAFSHNRF